MTHRHWIVVSGCFFGQNLQILADCLRWFYEYNTCSVDNERIDLSVEVGGQWVINWYIVRIHTLIVPLYLVSLWIFVQRQQDCYRIEFHQNDNVLINYSNSIVIHRICVLMRLKLKYHYCGWQAAVVYQSKWDNCLLYIIVIQVIINTSK